jgi:hypothetical protein
MPLAPATAGSDLRCRDYRGALVAGSALATTGLALTAPSEQAVRSARARRLTPARTEVGQPPQGA